MTDLRRESPIRPNRYPQPGRAGDPGGRGYSARALLVASGALVVGATLLLPSVVWLQRAAPTVAVDPGSCAAVCSLPPGIEFAALPSAQRAVLARRAVACADLACGRISQVAYADALLALEAPAECPAPVVTGPQWATMVRASSSQYSATDWSTAQLLGPPDVYPSAGDHVKAWASQTADGQIEFVEVGFSGTQRAAGVRILETYNPGAVSRVDLYSAEGETLSVHELVAVPTGTEAFDRTIRFECTEIPVAAVRVTLDSPRVPGWNELDAIALLPCE